MGHSSTKENIAYLLMALGDAMREQGTDLDVGAGVKAALE